MPIHSVSYDLRAPGRNYEELYAFLKDSSDWCRPSESYWLVVRDESASRLRDKIQEVVDSNDVVLVITISTPTGWGSQAMSKELNAWFRKYLG